eukprot:4354724-Pyramimonas_sp.AAC.1
MPPSEWRSSVRASTTSWRAWTSWWGSRPQRKVCLPCGGQRRARGRASTPRAWAPPQPRKQWRGRLAARWRG